MRDVLQGELRRWKALDKPLTAAMAIVSNDLKRAIARAERAETILAAVLNVAGENPRVRAVVARFNDTCDE